MSSQSRLWLPVARGQGHLCTHGTDINDIKNIWCSSRGGDHLHACPGLVFLEHGGDLRMFTEFGAVKPRSSSRGYKAPRVKTSEKVTQVKLVFPSVRSKILPVHKTYGRARPKVKPLPCPPPQQRRLCGEPTEEIGPTSDSVGIRAVCGGEDVNKSRARRSRSGAYNTPSAASNHQRRFHYRVGC